MNCIHELHSQLCPIHYLACVILFISSSNGVNMNIVHFMPNSFMILIFFRKYRTLFGIALVPPRELAEWSIAVSLKLI